MVTQELPWVINEHLSAAPKAPPQTSSRPIDFHRRMPGYRPTALTEVRGLVGGVGEVWVKDESSRLGLPAFKMLGASWAISRALTEQLGLAEVPDLRELRRLVADVPPVTLVTATDGNHGRAVARMAGLLGLPAMIVIPAVVPEHAIEAIRSEGAQVRVLDLSYDDTVRAAAELAGPDQLLIQDTAWDGYEQIPRWIVDGYSTMFDELSTDLTRVGRKAGLLVVPAGVGSLAHAAVEWAQATGDVRVVCVEPTSAACLTASLAAGRPVTVETSTTSMSGLNCGTPSTLSFEALLTGVFAAVTVDEASVAAAVADLGSLGVNAGPCGAASLAALRAITAIPPLARAAEVDAQTVAVLLNTEGVAGVVET